MKQHWFCDFFMTLKNDINVPLKSNKQKGKKTVLKVTDKKAESGEGSVSGRERAESLSRMSAPPVKKPRAHTANMRLVRVGLMDQTVVTTIPSTFGILCLAPLILVHKVSSWKRTIV
jgi:hypothetical protein